MQPSPTREPPDTTGGIRFDRNELAGAFGDMGTDVPLLIGITLAARLDGASVLLMYGAMQVLTGLVYRMPMPVQPLKAMAAIVIAQNVAGPTLYGAGLAIGIAMLLLSLTGMLDWLARVVPKPVVRGIQFGLGLQLASIALRDYVQSSGMTGYVLALVAFVLVVFLLGNRRFPAALPVVGLGLVYAMVFALDWQSFGAAFGFKLPTLAAPSWENVWAGFVLLALPQIPLSLGNSVLATRQLSEDLFPERRLTVRKIGITYAVMNLINPWFGGIPTCHGSGGMAGHYAFGGRTGGSVIIYGLVFLTLGLFFGSGMDSVIRAFPLPILGILLLFEALALVALLRDVSWQRLPVALLVGLCAVGLPYGYLVGLVLGTILIHLHGRVHLVTPDVPFATEVAPESPTVERGIRQPESATP